MGTRPNKYQKQASLGIVGLFLIASPILLKLPSQFDTFNSTTQLETEAAQEKAEIEASEDLERVKIEQKKQTADKLKETGILPSGDRLKIRDYYDNSQWNPNPNTTGFLKEEIVFVYDSAGVCIGQIRERKWLWKHFYRNVCNNVPAM
ncbi:hypothetical protein NDI39_29690 [Microcoleus sp. ZQ-A2]|nr:hypothetical protein [Microcoleus sp. FACHB-1]